MGTGEDLYWYYSEGFKESSDEKAVLNLPV